MLHTKLTNSDYYDTYPSLSHVSGDIWRGLPTFGLLDGHDVLPGIVITPVCDLKHWKTHVITYLPIIPITSYLASPFFLPEICSELNKTLSAHKSMYKIDILDTYISRTPPEFSAIESFLNIAYNTKKEDSLVKAIAALKLMKQFFHEPPHEINLQHFFSYKQSHAFMEKIINNVYKQDIHFLPIDGQPPSWSVICSHSLVLFRFGFTVPIEILEAAQNINLLRDWNEYITSIDNRLPIAKYFQNSRPIKLATLKAPFFTTLLSRYTSMYMRIGSPDFTEETRRKYAEQIVGEKI